MILRKVKKTHLVLYLLIIVIVLLSLIVMPRADTENPNAFVDNTQYFDKGAKHGGSEATGGAITVSEEVTGSAIIGGTEVTGGAITGGAEVTKKAEEVDDKKKTDDKKKSPKKNIYKYENNDIIVKAVFSHEENIPDNIELCVKPITEDNDKGQYSTVEAKVNASVEAENQIVTSFLAYDIYFISNGIKYEPELGNVNVSIQYKNKIFDDSIKKASDKIKVLHFKETDKGIQIEDVTQEVDIIDFDKNTQVNDSGLIIDNANVDTGIGKETDSEINKQAETETNKTADTGINKGTETETNKATDTGINKGTETSKANETGINKQTETKTNKETDTGINKGTETETNKANETGINKGTEIETNKATDTGMNKGTDTGANKQNNTETIKGTNIEKNMETDTETNILTDIGSSKENKGENKGSDKTTDIDPDKRSDTEVIKDGSAEINGADTINFVTNSFSTFVVTGVSTNTKPIINVKMKFMEKDTINKSVSGKYYLNVTDSSNNRYNLALNVSNGIATAEISGLYDQNGATKADKSLYPLTNGNYTAVLFKYPSDCPTNFKWDQNYTNNVEGCVKYELSNEIIENYYITEYSNEITVKSNVGTLAITATAKSGTKFSSSQILSLLTPVRPYSVFTLLFDLVGDMEGCIAAKKANLSHNIGNSSKNTNNYNCSKIRTITVNKTYNGSDKKTFKFGLYQVNNLSETLCETATITLPALDGSNKASVTFTAADTTSTYSVYELGDNNEKLLVGDNYNGYTLTSKEMKTDSVSSTINNISYIETIGSSIATPLRQGTNGLKNCLVVGSGYTVLKENNDVCVYEGNKKVLSAEAAYCDISAANGSFPIDFNTTLSNMANVSENLATAISSDTVMVKYMTIAELNNKCQKELTFDTNGRMLLLNIDATGTTNISLEAPAKFVVNGEACAGWSRQANNIVVNIFTKNGNTYSAYTGNITQAGFLMGTLLVPCANVNRLGQNFNGNIVAKYVRNEDGQVHGNTMGTIIIKTVYEFINSEALAIILPVTGGIGVYVFYGLGLVIILLGIGLMVFYQIHRKKRNGPKVINK